MFGGRIVKYFFAQIREIFIALSNLTHIIHTEFS